MSAGTLTLTNNSAAVAGNGTAFTTEVAAGDFIVVTVGGVPYTLPIKSVESGTALTLVSNFTGPTQTGAAWSAVPRVALNMVTAALVTQSAEALRGLNYDKQNWQSLFSGNGTVTVRLPDGTSWNGPAWNGIVTELAKKLDKNSNLSDVSDNGEARNNLGLAYGNTAGTVAQGNDNRLNTINGKSGGSVNGNGAFDIPYPDELNRQGGIVNSRILVGGAMRAFFAHYVVTENAIRRGVLHVQQDDGPAAVQAAYYFDTTGNAVAPGAWVPTSDIRFKDEVSIIESPEEKMRNIRGCTWIRKDTGKWGIGFIAQDVKKSFPEAVTEGGDKELPDGTVISGVLYPDTYGVAAALHHEAILTLMDKIENLYSEVLALKSKGKGL
ncbi:tail fiber domain-containing protein [Citrobacter portucalensis]|uniref:tail fiber domain-containing protein n=1 Tax=Citrobacter freundii complex sp. 2024EL-00216 TaxID=3374258 RepID=UPI003751A37E